MYQRTIRVPVEITFSTDPAELDGREGEESPTKESLLAYLKDALLVDVDNEGKGQPEGAVVAAAGIDWDAAELVAEPADDDADDENSLEEQCGDSLTGKHVPDPKSIRPADGAGSNRGTDWLIDVNCIYCGRGSSMQINPDDLQW